MRASLPQSAAEPMGYGSPQFDRAARVARRCKEIEGVGLRAAWARLRAGRPLLVWYSLRVPSVAVRVTGRPEGVMIAEHFAIRDRGRWRFRRAQGVLPLPADFPQYLRGRHRQAVRTNVSHARRAGLTVRSCTVEEWAPGPDDTRAGFITPGPIERWMVLDADGAIVADSILSVDREVALLHGLVSTVSYARWLLHTAIVERLCGCCSLLLVNSEDATLLSAGNQHYQRLLGYAVVNLRPSFGQRRSLEWAPVHRAALGLTVVALVLGVIG